MANPKKKSTEPQFTGVREVEAPDDLKLPPVPPLSGFVAFVFDHSDERWWSSSSLRESIQGAVEDAVETCNEPDTRHLRVFEIR